jgi:hypothetical protein
MIYKIAFKFYVWLFLGFETSLIHLMLGMTMAKLLAIAKDEREFQRLIVYAYEMYWIWNGQYSHAFQVELLNRCNDIGVT